MRELENMTRHLIGLAEALRRWAKLEKERQEALRGTEQLQSARCEIS